MASTKAEQRRASRRGILTKGAALGAAALALRAAGGDRASAANGDPVKVGTSNGGTKLTEIGGNFAGPVFSAYNDAAGRGVAGIMGFATAIGLGIPDGKSPGGAGVWGHHGGVNGAGVYGEATEKFANGVFGYASGTGSTGVNGFSEQGSGIFAGTTSTDDAAVEAKGKRMGVDAFADTEYSWGVYATSKGESGKGVSGNAPGFSGVGVEGVGGSAGVTGSGKSVGVSGSGRTGVDARGDATGLFAVAYQDDGLGMHSLSPFIGVLGDVQKQKQDGPGVWGNTGQDIDTTQAGGTQVGVLGTSGKIGVAGVAAGSDLTSIKALTNNAGVVGIGSGAQARGVVGTTEEKTGIGVLAANPQGDALSVEGVNRFSQAFRGRFAVGKRVAVIGGLDITATSGVIANLNSVAGPGISLLTVRANPTTGKVRLTLTKPAKRPAAFTLFVVDTPE